MNTRDSLLNQLKKSKIDPEGTLMVHSSMKAIGETKGGADTVLDVLIDYMKDGLVLFPTHSWSEKNLENSVYDPEKEKSCTGILTNLAMKRPGAVRSLHPTHSVTAIGKRAEEYIRKDDNVSTPCPRNGCFFGLYDELHGQIAFLGAKMTKNTFIHCLEEYLQIPDRISNVPKDITIVTKESKKKVKIYPHFSSLGDVSQNYIKLEEPLIKRNIAFRFQFGESTSIVADVKEMADITLEWLKENPDLFSDSEALE